MSPRDEVWGNLFYRGSSLYYFVFFDVDDDQERLQIAVNAGLEIIPSRSHQLGHAVKRAISLQDFLAQTIRIDHKMFWQNQCIKFLRVTPGLRDITRGYQSVITKWIDRDRKYQPSEYQILMPKSARQLRHLLILRRGAIRLKLDEKISGIILKLLCEGYLHAATETKIQ